MQLTVIIPTYKPGKYIFDCLESLNAQTLEKKDFCIIIVLNGCNNPYYKEIKDYSDNHKSLNIIIIQTDQPGVSNARNIGLSNTRTEYVCFIDDDDVVSPTFLERLVTLSDSETIVAADVKLTDWNLNVTDHNFFLDKAFREFNSQNQHSLFRCRKFLSNACGKIIPMAIVRDKKFVTSLELGEDSLFMFTISDNIKRVIITPNDAIYYARERPQSATRRKIAYKHRVAVCFSLVARYILLWVKNPLKYNFLLFLSRVVASIYKLFLKTYK